MSGKVLLVVIDAATPHVVCPAIQTGRLPVFQKLVEAGVLHQQSASIFPSITPAATSTIITGGYPAEHGIAGASWYDAAREEVAYYGDDFWIIAREGFGHFINDFLLRLNGDRLTAPTVFQMVERAGRQAACLNYLVFKGNVPHKVNIPGLMAALPGVPFTETVEGPSFLCLGDFVTQHTREGKVDRESGLLHRFGMDDASTGVMLCDLADENGLRDFTVAYFADNDYVSHEVGPVMALPVVERVDRMLGEMFEKAGGIEKFLSHTTVVITSDHGHCEVLNDPSKIIRLDRVLANFRQADLGRAWKKHDELMICPNMRATQIYVQSPTREKITQVVLAILEDPNVDQVIWCSRLTSDRPGYEVASPRGRLHFARGTDRGQTGVRPGSDLGQTGVRPGSDFGQTGVRPGSDGGQTCVDAFGGFWTWSGDPEVLGIHQDGRTVDFVDYPNAFERLAGALDLEKSGEIWVTAKPGCEFEVPGGKAHAGGASHGALHALDSFSPVIVAGAGAPRRLPRHMRSADIAPLCMEILGIPMRYKVGDPRK